VKATSADTIVIGAGVNGLVTAAYLARAGRKVTVLERQKEPGPSSSVGWIPPKVVRELGLETHGLVTTRLDPWIAAPLPGGGRLELWQNQSKSVEAIRRISPADADQWPAFCERLGRLAGLLEALYLAPPPDLHSSDLGELLRLARFGWRARALGKQTVVDLLRIMPMSVAELLDDWFESDVLKGLLGAAGVLNICEGPRSGGTAFVLLHHHVGSPRGVFRPGVSNVASVLEQVARASGVEIRRGAEVARITVKDGRATGVVLASGEEIPASLVASSADTARTLLDFVEPGWLDPEFVRAVQHIKCRGVTARVTLTLFRAVDFQRVVIAPSLEYLERAYDDAKYGRVSARPYIEARADGATLHADVQYVPYALREGPWDDARRKALGDLTMTLLAEQMPGLGQAVVGKGVEVLTPRDLHDRYGLPGGHLYHGELTLDQILFMRPVPGCAEYRTPVEGLYLCGAGTHPGGGILGGAGHNAARAIGSGVR
jgi:phytoene dehydrogenase-like protein